MAPRLSCLIAIAKRARFLALALALVVLAAGIPLPFTPLGPASVSATAVADPAGDDGVLTPSDRGGLPAVLLGRPAVIDDVDDGIVRVMALAVPPDARLRSVARPFAPHQPCLDPFLPEATGPPVSR